GRPLESRVVPDGRSACGRRPILGIVPLVAAIALCVGVTASASSPKVNMPYAMVVRIIDEPTGKYQVEVENTNPTRYINSFNWTPPLGLTISAITSTIGGKCRLSSDGTINCTGEAAPPVCDSGECVGESMIVNFTAAGGQPSFVTTSYGGYWIHRGVVGAVVVR